MKKPALIVFLLFIFCMLMWTGCSQKMNGLEPENVIIETPVIELTTITETATLQSSFTPTWTSSPTLPLPTSTPSPIPLMITPTPLPTMNKIERQTYFTEHLPNNNNCELPCWLGIKPGQTPLQDANAFLDRLGTNIYRWSTESGRVTYNGSFGFEEPTISQDFRIFEQKNMVSGIHLSADGYNAPIDFQKIWSIYSPKNIMRTYGTPSRVWLSTISSIHGTSHPYDLIIAYDEQGIIVHYSGWVVRAGVNFRICPRFEQGMDIQAFEVYLQAPGDTRPLEESGNFTTPQLISKWSKRIHEATGLSEEQFADIFSDGEKTGCFNTPINIWPKIRKP